MWRIRQTKMKAKGKKAFIHGLCIRSLKVILINKNQPLIFKCSTYLHESIHRFTVQQLDKWIDLFDITTLLMSKRLLKNE